MLFSRELGKEKVLNIWWTNSFNFLKDSYYTRIVSLPTNHKHSHVHWAFSEP